MTKNNNGIKITVGKYEIRMYLTKGKVARNGLVANVTIAVEDLVVKGFKLIAYKDSYFLANPSTQSGKDYYDQAYFLDTSIREQIETAVIKEYESEVE